MEFGVIFLLVIAFTSIDFFIYLNMKEKFRNTSTRVEDEYNKIRTKYEELKGEVEVLKKELQEKEAYYVKLKNKQEVKAKEEAESKPDEVKILLSEKLVSLHDIKKAKEFIKNNNSPLSIVDVLVMLGKLDAKGAELVKSKIGKDG
ncbi:hypothetical protein JCM13304A_01730 [Desulfothermus okinawensis JCM 13304]